MDKFEKAYLKLIYEDKMLDHRGLDAEDCLYKFLQFMEPLYKDICCISFGAIDVDDYVKTLSDNKLYTAYFVTTRQYVYGVQEGLFNKIRSKFLAELKRRGIPLQTFKPFTDTTRLIPSLKKGMDEQHYKLYYANCTPINWDKNFVKEVLENGRKLNKDNKDEIRMLLVLQNHPIIGGAISYLFHHHWYLTSVEKGIINICKYRYGEISIDEETYEKDKLKGIPNEINALIEEILKKPSNYLEIPEKEYEKLINYYFKGTSPERLVANIENPNKLIWRYAIARKLEMDKYIIPLRDKLFNHFGQKYVIMPDATYYNAVVPEKIKVLLQEKKNNS